VSFISSIFNFLRFNKKNWKAVVLCLFAATVFWFFNALNKNYSANINFPLTFDYDQEKYIPVKKLPSTLRINVSGLGWDLFRKSSGLKVPPLVIPLEHPTEIRKIVGSTLPALFTTQLEGLQINFVLTDTLYVSIDERIKKKLALKVDSLRKYLHADYGLLGEVEIGNDSVLIEGPRRVLDSLGKTITLQLPDKNINRDFNEEVEITFRNDQLVKRDPPVTFVSFEVEKLVEVNDRIELTIVNIPKRSRSAIEVKEVNCTFRLPVSLVKKIPEDSLRAVIDLKDLPRGSYKIVPTIKGLPGYAHIVKIDTVRVNF
jgi:hypothetical protein